MHGILYLKVYVSVHADGSPFSCISLWSYVSTREWDTGPIYSVNTGIPWRGVNSMPSFFKLSLVNQRYWGCIFQMTEKADFNMGLSFRNEDYTVWLTGMLKWDVYSTVMEYFKTASCPWWTTHSMSRVRYHFLLWSLLDQEHRFLGLLPLMINFSKFHWCCWLMRAYQEENKLSVTLMLWRFKWFNFIIKTRIQAKYFWFWDEHRYLNCYWYQRTISMVRTWDECFGRHTLSL